MPKKSKRIAVRHAQLSGRARRMRPHGPSGIPTKAPEPSVSKPSDEDGVFTEALLEEPAAEPHRTPRDGTVAEPVTPSPRPRRRGMARPSPALYFKSEIRRIAVASGIIFAMLTVLIFVL